MITSLRNPRVVEAAALGRATVRKRTERTLVEGPFLVGEALDAGFPLETLFAEEGDPLAARARDAGVDIILVGPGVIDRIATTGTPRGPVAVAPVPRTVGLEPGVDALILWGVGDPGNAGTLLRTAAAFGWQVAAGPDTVDLWAPKTLRASGGAGFGRAPAQIDAIPTAGWTTVATVVSGGTPLPALVAGSPWAVLIGDEAGGLPDDLVSGADARVTIPMPGGIESLNAAVAGAIVLYELAVRR